MARAIADQTEKMAEQLDQVQKARQEKQGELIKRISGLNGEIKMLQDELRNAEMESVSMAALINQGGQFQQWLMGLGESKE